MKLNRKKDGRIALSIIGGDFRRTKKEFRGGPRGGPGRNDSLPKKTSPPSSFWVMAWFRKTKGSLGKEAPPFVQKKRDRLALALRKRITP